MTKEWVEGSGYIHDVGLVHGCHFFASTLMGQLEGVFGNAQGLGLGDNLQALHHSCHALRRGQERSEQHNGGAIGHSPIAEHFWLLPWV